MHILKSEIKTLTSDFLYFFRKILPYLMLTLYIAPLIAIFYTALRSDDDFWLTGNVFRVISQRDYSMFFEGMRFIRNYTYGFVFSLSVSFISFFIALKLKHYTFRVEKIWFIVFVFSLLPAFIYSPMLTSAEYPFTLFFFINTARYLFLAVLLIEKIRLPRDIIFMIMLSVCFSEFSIFYASAGGYFYNNLFRPDFSVLPPKQYYSTVLAPSAMIISIIILWAALRYPVIFLLNHLNTVKKGDAA